MYIMVKEAQLFNHLFLQTLEKMGLKLKQTLHGEDSSLENFSA